MAENVSKEELNELDAVEAEGKELISEDILKKIVDDVLNGDKEDTEAIAKQIYEEMLKEQGLADSQ
jgi:hypothetical protein